MTRPAEPRPGPIRACQRPARAQPAGPSRDRRLLPIATGMADRMAVRDMVGAAHGKPRPFDLVFHGGSGSALEDIREAISYGVVKMNVDTDTQYAFTRPVAGHMFTNYDGVLKVDGEVGNKKVYDPRSWGKAAEAAMAARVVEACEDLLSAGKQLT